MKALHFRPVSMLAGAGLATIAFFAMGQSSVPAGSKWEFRIMSDASAEDVETLSADRWEYVGYLGQGTKGMSNDETLWRRSVK